MMLPALAALVLVGAVACLVYGLLSLRKLRAIARDLKALQESMAAEKHARTMQKWDDGVKRLHAARGDDRRN